ncbi:MAG: Fe-S cluster assembly protein SufB, partial [Amylibacter sp.]|nr:Fe-S cluster assembly protein SufB [Amylibacter sp.]
MDIQNQVQVKEGVDQNTVDAVQTVGGSYKYGFETDIEIEYAPKGLSKDIVRLISNKNGEPEWMLKWRLDAYDRWLQMEEPEWAMVNYPKIDFQDQYY